MDVDCFFIERGVYGFVDVLWSRYRREDFLDVGRFVIAGIGFKRFDRVRV